MPQGWRQRFCCTSCLVVEGSPTTHCSLTVSNSQLRTEERARLKSTTLSTGEGRHNAVPLHRRRGAIRKGEFKSKKLGDRMRLRKETREQDSNPRVLLLFPSLSHIHYWRPGQPRIGTTLAADSRILNAELTARDASHSHPQEMTVSVMI